jgi:5'-nucleotidase
MPPLDLSQLLVVAVSSRALFNLESEARMYDRLGPEAFRQHQVDNEDEILEPGTAFLLVKGLLGLNRPGDRAVEVMVVSRNNPETGLRVRNSIAHYGLDISRTMFVEGDPIVPYLQCYDCDLFLSCSQDDVQLAIDAGIAAAGMYRPPNNPETDLAELRIAVDGDAVLFSDESEFICQSQGLPAFHAHELASADQPLPAGPLAKLLVRLGTLQRDRRPGELQVKLAIVTARNAPADVRVIKTLRKWGIRVNAAFFLGGIAKHETLKAFGAHMFFDDQAKHLAPASVDIPCAIVPYRSDSSLRNTPVRVADSLGNE